MKRQPLPMTVSPPPCTVPRLIVTHSRKVLRSPTTRRVGSPRYFRSCGISPMTAWEKTRFPSPSVVWPFTTACAASVVRGPSTTFGPTTAYGPISHDGSTCAPGSTMAVGWIAMFSPPLLSLALAVREHGHELRLGDRLPVHDGRALLAPDRP